MGEQSVERYQYIGERGQDEEADFVEDRMAPVDRRGRARRWVLAMVSAAAVAAVVAALRPREDLTVASLSDSTEEFGKPFTQCGGQTWHKSTCCQKGCACVKQTVYYSQCEPPTGKRACSIFGAKKEVGAAKNRIADRKRDVETKKSDQKGAEKRLSDAEDVHDKARKAWREAADKAEEKKKLNKDAEAESVKKSADVLKSAKDERDKVIKEMNDKVDEVKKKAEHDVAEVERTETKKQDDTLKAAKEKLAKALKDAKEKKGRLFKEAAEKLARKLKAAREEHDTEVKDAEREHEKLEFTTKKKMEKDIHDFRADQEAAKKEAKEARDKASKVGKEYYYKHKDWKWAHDHVEKFKEDEKLRKKGGCAKLFGNCAQSKCCIFGCECQWKNKFFAQCVGEWGAGNCNWKLSEKKLKGSKEALPKLTKLEKKLSVEVNTTDKAAIAAEKKAKELHEHLEGHIKHAKKEAAEKIADAKKRYHHRIAAAKTLFEKKTSDAKEEAESSKKEASREAVETVKDAKAEYADTVAPAKKAVKARKAEAQKQAEKDNADVKEEAKTKIKAAKEKAEKTVADVRKQVKAETTQSRKVYDDAVSVREDKAKIMKDKNDLKGDAEKDVLRAKKEVAKAKAALKVAHGAIASWKTAAKGGNVCKAVPKKKVIKKVMVA